METAEMTIQSFICIDYVFDLYQLYHRKFSQKFYALLKILCL